MNRMNIKIFILIFCSLNVTAFSQNNYETLHGSVSFISSQNVYVKFENTKGIQIGDTLYTQLDNKLNPVMVVKNISTISCVGSPIVQGSLALSDLIYAKIPVSKSTVVDILEDTKAKKSVSVNDMAIKTISKQKTVEGNISRFDGRLSLSSYSNVSNYSSDQRLRYNLSLNAQHLNNSKFSAETYISFTHLLKKWNGFNNALKIYSLAVKYDINKTSNITLGRKINLNLANVGAIDGLQYEKTGKHFNYGAIVGSRPDYYDYSFNPDLMQFGAFVSHNIQNEAGNLQTSLAIFNQMNNFKTDRRFAYIQHSNTLINKLDLFCSFELDFYSMVNLQPKTSLDLTSSYISLRYKPWKKLSLTLSYDARKNIYYYETFKNQIDSIIDRETRQGLRFHFNYRPLKNLNWGGSAGYRYKKSDSIQTMNAHSYLTYNNVPIIDAMVSIDATMLKTYYMDGTIYGITFARDIIPGKLSGDLEYRLVNYYYNFSETKLQQNIASLSFSWRLAKKLSLSADFEATLEKNNNYGRLFVNLTKRF